MPVVRTAATKAPSQLLSLSINAASISSYGGIAGAMRHRNPGPSLATTAK